MRILLSNKNNDFIQQCALVNENTTTLPGTAMERNTLLNMVVIFVLLFSSLHKIKIEPLESHGVF